jgi:four helix bundle protein
MRDIRSYRDLLVWKKAMDIADEVFQITKQFPGDERFGLVSQLRRAVVSVPSNIAEGYGRGSRPDYLRFLRNARGSLYEVDTQLQLSLRFGYIDATTHAGLCDQINDCGRTLAGLIRSLDESSE